VTVVEPSDQLYAEEVNGVPVRYVKPNPDGSLPFDDASFDLITCFGVLHHIATVSRVVAELHRCLRPGGYALVREPTNSMGDWRQRRPGLTKRERGIPIALFRRILAEAGFRVVAEQPCMFSLVNRLAIRGRKTSLYNSPLAMRVDRILCRLFAWNRVYHATNNLARFRPQSVFYVLTRP
jgi:SAM-dependent methyltransferase